MKTAGVTDLLRILPKIQSVYCDEMLNDAELIREISHADAVIGELIYLCSSLVADKLSLPHVLISASTLSSPTAVALGLPSPPSYVPQWGTSLTNELKFVDRMKNVLQWMLMYYFYIYDFCPLFNEVKTRHNITPDKPIQETLGRVDMIIGQMDFTLEYPRPLLPSKELNRKRKSVYLPVCLHVYLFTFFYLFTYYLFSICKSAYELSGPSGRRLWRVSVARSDLRYFFSPLDGMLVHRKVTPSIKFVGTQLYSWVERGLVRVKCLA